MSELEEIKQRAAERRARPTGDNDRLIMLDNVENQRDEAEVDLGRAIEIAEKNLRAFEDCWSSHQAQKKELNQLSASVKRGDHLLMKRYREVVGERDQARADVLKLRDEVWGLDQALHSECGSGPFVPCQLLTDTESYEQYR